eukprot:CAMPEP_0180408130 /NCGR_PEP_ID=MMETSP0989-20121125/42105_1 /TAXON_ID=697907 /ORGANISM="non described non described, Strain CCMP2293" /LENGTH=143 /DNA_ID=CAMNT_0022412033 /DNA_START=217 /DNA_END=644 /DNA_ORIENTATION=+
MTRASRPRPSAARRQPALPATLGGSRGCSGAGPSPAPALIPLSTLSSSWANSSSRRVLASSSFNASTSSCMPMALTPVAPISTRLETLTTVPLLEKSTHALAAVKDDLLPRSEEEVNDERGGENADAHATKRRSGDAWRGMVH